MKQLFTNCVLVDKTSTLNEQKVDILINDDVIEQIATSIKSVDCTTIDMNSAYVSAGWIDIHTHCFEETTDISINADKIGVDTGVVCIIDAGSSGEKNIDKFYQMTKECKTIIKAWINIASTGLENRSELKDLNNINVEKTISKANEYKDFVVGIKVRASASVMSDDMHTPFVKAKEVSNAIDKPIMVHIGNFPPTIDEVLEELGENDILTHCYHGKPNGVVFDEQIRKTVLQKRIQGLRYDVGHGQESFSYAIAKKAIKLGFKPDSISSDLHKYNYDGPVYNLANVMSKMLSLLSLEEVVHYVTAAPAKIVKLEEFGHVDEKRKAHLTFFNVCEKHVELVDSMKDSVSISKIILPIGCVVSGKYMEVSEHGKVI